MSDERTRLRVAEHRCRRELERADRRMAATERALQAKLEALDGEIHLAETTIDAYLRLQHWGREPEHPPKWTAPTRDPP
jgi:hypothetical protein